MKCTSNVHTHSTWCDGMSTPRRIAEQAEALGFSDVGFSSHSPAAFDPGCPGISDEQLYQRDILELKKEYADRLTILCGIERDYYSPPTSENYDYVIGSVHYFPFGADEKIAVDANEQDSLTIKNELFDGDGLAMAQSYYALCVENVRRFRPFIVGHYDLIGKYNKSGLLFDEDSPAYQRLALRSLNEIIDVLLPYGGMIEVNTGAFVRKLRSVPYPAPFLLKQMARRGVRAIITSDSHNASTLNAGFDEALGFLKRAGFKKISELKNGAFIDTVIPET